MNFVAGVWLVLAPLVLDYPPAGLGLAARSNDVAIGGILALIALTRMIVPESTVGLAVIAIIPGLWLTAAPFVFGYDGPAMWNDVLVGVVIVVGALLSGLVALRGPAKNRPGAAGPERTR